MVNLETTISASIAKNMMMEVHQGKELSHFIFINIINLSINRKGYILCSYIVKQHQLRSINPIHGKNLLDQQIALTCIFYPLPLIVPFCTPPLETPSTDRILISLHLSPLPILEPGTALADLMIYQHDLISLWMRGLPDWFPRLWKDGAFVPSYTFR